MQLGNNPDRKQIHATLILPSPAFGRGEDGLKELGNLGNNVPNSVRLFVQGRKPLASLQCQHQRFHLSSSLVIIEYRFQLPAQITKDVLFTWSRDK